MKTARVTGVQFLSPEGIGGQIALRQLEKFAGTDESCRQMLSEVKDPSYIFVAFTRWLRRRRIWDWFSSDATLLRKFIKDNPTY